MLLSQKKQITIIKVQELVRSQYRRQIQDYDSGIKGVICTWVQVKKGI